MVGESGRKREKAELHAQQLRAMSIARVTNTVPEPADCAKFKELALLVLEAARLNQKVDFPLSLAAAIAANDCNTAYIVHLLLSVAWNDSLAWAEAEAAGVEHHKRSYAVGTAGDGRLDIADDGAKFKELALLVLEAARLRHECEFPLGVAAAIATNDCNTSYLVHLLLSATWNDALAWAEAEAAGKDLEYQHYSADMSTKDAVPVEEVDGA